MNDLASLTAMGRNWRLQIWISVRSAVLLSP